MTHGPLYAVLLEAQTTTGPRARVQWLVLPPAVAGECEAPHGQQRLIKRRLDRPGDTARWQHVVTDSPGALGGRAMEQLEQMAAAGWDVMRPLVVDMKHSEYVAAYSLPGKTPTPYDALRRIEQAAVRTRGQRLRDD